jgi:hypothetical protein
MINDKGIKQFVRETLGCTCPDEVFQHIDCRADVNASDGVLLDYEINIGNKLLIFVVTIDEPGSLSPLIPQLVWDGTNKRNQENFNRFRLVLLTQRPSHMAEEAFAIFQSLGADEKVHLHVVAKDDFPIEDLSVRK